MAVFRKWVKNCFDNLIDPDKDAEVEELTKLLHVGIAQRKQAFVLSEVLSNRPYKLLHLDQAKTNLYQMFLTRAWKDGQVLAAERQTLAWIAKALALSPEIIRSMNVENAKGYFAEALAQAMDDGEISAAEVARLEEISKAAGLSLRMFIAGFFRTNGETFLQGVFAACMSDNGLSTDAFNRMLITASRLGMSRADVLQAIQPQVERFIEHVLADAKQDDLLTQKEEALLDELLAILEPQEHTRQYILTEIDVLRTVRDIKRGVLPSLPAPSGTSLRAGELVHFHGRAAWDSLKVLKSGPSRTRHDGLLTVTDARLVFSSETRSHGVSYRKIVGHAFSCDSIEVQVQGKPTDRFVLAGPPRVPYAIFCSALAMANQTLTNQDESRNSRHIPRDIRQRVWQRYSARCADCRATDYLEFDHIVPVAKGGSNSEQNVQLLCRNCNLKKSDLI